MNCLSDSNDDIESSHTEENESPVKLNEAINAISTLRKFIYQTDSDIDPTLQMVNKTESFIYSQPKSSKQTQITDYFALK